MTISNTARKAGPFPGNGVTTAFAFAFKVFQASDLLVVLTDASGNDATQTLSSQYTVALNANQDANPGGTVTMLTPPDSTHTLTIGSQIPYTQPMVLTNTGGFYPTVLNDAADREVALIQQLFESLSRALKVSISTPAGVSTSLPAPSSSKVIGWTADGTALQNYDPTVLASNVQFSNWQYNTYAGDGVTTTFVLSGNPTVAANMDVSLHGVTQVPGTDFTVSGTSLTFAVAPPNGVKILARYGQAAQQAAIGQTVETQTATAGQTVFTVSTAFIMGTNALAVFLNGVRLTPLEDYTETSTTSITLTSGATVGDKLLFAIGASSNSASVQANVVAYTPAGTGAVTTDVQTALRKWASFEEYGATGDGVTDDTTAVQNALNTGKPIIGTTGKTYYCSGVITMATAGQSLFLNGATLKCQQLSITADNVTVDLGGGGTIAGLLHTSTVASVAAVGQKNVTVTDGTQFKVGDQVWCSWGDNVSNFPLSTPNAIAAINGNVLTLTNNLSGSVNLIAGVYIGTFAWGTLIGHGTAAPKHVVIRNGKVTNAPGYFHYINRWNQGDYATNIARVSFEDIDFTNNGLDMFLYTKSRVSFLRCTFGEIVNGVPVGGTYDVAKQGFNYGDGADIYLERCRMARGNFDIDFQSYTSSGQGVYFSDPNTKITAVDCYFDGTNKFSSDPYFGTNALHPIVLQSGGYTGGTGVVNMGNFTFRGCKWNNYSRHLIGNTVTTDTAQIVVESAVFDDCQIGTGGLFVWQTSSGSGVTVKDFVFNNCRMYGSGSQYWIQDSNLMNSAKFNNCYIKLQGMTNPRVNNADMQGGMFELGTVQMGPQVRCRDVTLKNCYVTTSTLDSNAPGMTGHFIIDNASFTGTIQELSTASIMTLAADNTGGWATYGQGNGVTVRNKGGSLTYQVAAFNGKSYLMANLQASWFGATFRGLVGTDYILGVTPNYVPSFGQAGKFTLTQPGTLASGAAASATSVTMTAGGVGSPGSYVAAGDLAFCQLSNGTVFVTTVAGGYAGGGALTVPLTNALPQSMASGAVITFARFVQL